ncbi:Uncharacterized protein FKW44_023912 [Caligus rogercresseyi]|uniref:Uncharacterized protein n=1 Tax=Caligus rogercresseyi TaxID=217165 RepID=A0A7T8JUL0_CALRO|nr:Uncharacterized protein FKW44_023912 [Caligus rogercresseyi]
MTDKKKEPPSLADRLSAHILNNHAWLLLFVLIPISLAFDILSWIGSLVNAVIGYSSDSTKRRFWTFRDRSRPA